MFKKEEKKKEEQVAEPKAKPAAAAAAAADAIISAVTDEIMIFDLEGNILMANEAWEKSSGFKAEEVVGKPVFEMLPMPPKIAGKVLEIIQEIVEKGHTGPTETVVTSKDGTRRPILFSASLIKDHEGNPMNIVAVSKDITELKRLQEKEKEATAAQERATIVDAMPDALVVLDLDGKVVSINPALTTIFGYESEKIVGKGIDDMPGFVRPEDIERSLETFKELLETGSAKPIELVTRTKDGREITFSATYSIIKDAEGKPKNIIASLRDITELKKAEEERMKAVAAAAAADKARAEEAEKYGEELEAKVKELEEFSKIAVERELDMKKVEEELEKVKGELEKLKRTK